MFSTFFIAGKCFTISYKEIDFSSLFFIFLNLTVLFSFVLNNTRSFGDSILQAEGHKIKIKISLVQKCSFYMRLP